MSVKNTQELRELLLQAIEKTQKGDMEPRVASAIVGLSGQVINTCQVDMAYAKMTATIKKDVPAVAFLPGKK